MAIPEINFDTIRAHDGSRNAAFEELCCQLASLEPRAPDTEFFRKGRGGDAGVECFERQSDGSEIGWQAKYVSSWTASLASQLDDSIRTALTKHPRLTKLAVCLPFDLPDARAGRSKTPLQQWEAWRNKWTAAAKAEHRTLEIVLWSKSLITERLSRDEPAYAGRVYYWFNQEALTSSWFKHQFEKARAGLGSRYTPETNVELPIRQEFLGFTRDPSLNLALHEWNVKLQEAAHSAIRAVQEADKDKLTDFPVRLAAAIEVLVKSLSDLPIPIDRKIPIVDWCEAAKPVADIAVEALTWTYGLPAPDKKKAGSMGVAPADWARHCLYGLSDLTGNVIEDLNSRRWHLANASAMLLYGDAGTGKSHLFGDVVEHQVGIYRPALLVLGSTFVDGDPWRQILTAVDLPATLQVKHFLAALDAAAQAEGVRALICIDALNERNGLDVWPTRLASFLEELRPFPRVAVALSCRSTYLHYIVPDSVTEAALPRIEHMGFAGHASEAAKVYLDKRGIVRPGAPNLVPEFENPLFLKTCCDYLQKEGKRELPKGLSGVTEIFGFYVEAVSRALNLRMKLDPHLDIGHRAIRGLADAIVAEGAGYLEKSKAIGLLESILPSNGLLDRSLLVQLESEGAVAIEILQLDDGSRSDQVRFTFERFSDHQIALALLDRHLNAADPAASFAVGTPLHELVQGKESYKRAGVIEAISIQLPERVQVELIDAVPDGKKNWYLREPFMESLPWRNQRYFSDRTFALLKDFAETEDFTAILFSLATEPDNKFNARYLHDRLMALSLSERDKRWTPIANRIGDEDASSMATLISWSLSNGMEAIEDDRAELAAIALSWLLTSSNRAVRDRSTKALACLLSNRLSLASQLILRFEKVNDPYVLERVFTAIYGGVLQGTAQDGHADLASTIFKSVFADGTPPVNVLLRDSAVGILEYVKWRGFLPETVRLEIALPPYRSEWPIEFVPDELIETYKQDDGQGSFRDEIVGSTVNDGDFARYQIDPLVHHWSQSKIGSEEPESYQDIALGWIDEVMASITEPQLAAFEQVKKAAKENKGGYAGYQVTPEIAKLNAAEEIFRQTLRQDQWEEYRVRARNFVRYTLFAKDRHNTGQIALFDAPWARRWICKRAHEFGWTPERFGKIERYDGRDHERHKHRLERIGKKYQWLATYELAARMADNLTMLGYSYGKKDTQQYEGAWQIGLREMDPSLIVTETHYDGWQSWPRTWWVPVSPTLHEISREERLAWRNSEQDILNDLSLIEVSDPKSGRKWLALDGFASWRQSGISEGRSELQRNTWFRLNCIIVREADRAKLHKWLTDKRLTASRDLPELELHGDQYLGEYPWHPSLSDIPDWNEPDSWNKLTVETRTPVSSYSRERSGYDYSIEKTVRMALPAPWLMRALGLRLSNGRTLTYTDDKGRVLFFDPSVSEPGPHAALVDRDAFLAVLKRENLAAFWVIAGEKDVFSGHRSDRGWGGRLVHTYVYEFKNDAFSCHKHVIHEEPSLEQLSAFLGYDPLTNPAGKSVSNTAARGKNKKAK